MALDQRESAAWGTPHTEITRWAFRQLPASDRAGDRLGGVRQMEDLAWGGDYQGEVMPTYFVDDYLLFPSFPRLTSHLMPEVAQTWEPYFRRTLSALRGESPANAARWLGSLLHFVQDSGSPPHALPLTGVQHTRMENYVLALDVRLSGYTPSLLGETEETALRGLRRRLESLVEYSRLRAEKLRPLVTANDRLGCEPLVLECARETIRATADVAHTLLRLAPGPRPGTAVIRGRVRAPANPEFPLAPVRILVAGTDRATCADLGALLPGDRTVRGVYAMADLDPGTYEVIATRPGSPALRRRFRLRAGSEVRWDLDFPESPHPGNLVRNPDHSVRWLHRDSPDHWRLATAGAAEWRSDPIRLEPGILHRVGARRGREPLAVSVGQGDSPQAAAAAASEPTGGTIRARFPYLQVRVAGTPSPDWVHLAREPATPSPRASAPPLEGGSARRSRNSPTAP